MSRALDTAKSQQSNSGPTPPFVAGKNFQINGGFDIWQRGTTLNNVSHSTYTADQWVAVTDNIGTVNITQQNIAAQGLNSIYAMRVEKSAGASNRVVMVSVPEGALSCVGKTVTVSGYLRKGSGLTANVGIDLGTRASRYGTIYDGATTLSINNASLNTSTFTKFSLSFNVTTATSTNNANLFEFEVFFTQAGGANVYLEIAAIQIEVGSAATPFSRAGGTINGELAACQRYFYKTYNLETAPGTASTNTGGIAVAQVSSGANANWISCRFPVTMRTTPTVTIYNPETGATGQVRNLSSAQNVAASESYSGSNGFNIYITGASGGVGYVILGHATASAEL